MFFRRTDNLGNVRFVVVSQEPGFKLRKDYESPQEAEDFLARGCETATPYGRGLPNCIVRIFGRKDILKEEVYWTHCLKCAPYDSDKDIRGGKWHKGAPEWPRVAPLCSEILRSELELLATCHESEKLLVASMGGYATTMCNHILHGSCLEPVVSILQEIRKIDHTKANDFGEISVYTCAFVHPQNRKRVLNKHDKDGKVRAKEKEGLAFIRRCLEKRV